MALFRLLAGQHQQADPDWEPSPDEVQFARDNGVRLVAPSRTYETNDLVECDQDLVARFGEQKFQLVSGKPLPLKQVGGKSRTPGDPSRELMAKNKTKAPAGQVSTGFQGEDPNTVEGGEDRPEELDDEENAPPSAAPKGEKTLEQQYGGNFDEMNLEELREIASSEEIELKGATRKADIISVLRGAKK